MKERPKDRLDEQSRVKDGLHRAEDDGRTQKPHAQPGAERTHGGSRQALDGSRMGTDGEEGHGAAEENGGRRSAVGCERGDEHRQEATVRPLDSHSEEGEAQHERQIDVAHGCGPMKPLVHLHGQ